MEEFVSSATNQILQGVLTLVAIFVAFVIRMANEELTKYLRAKYGSEKTELMKSVATSVVRAIEQDAYITQLVGPEKKERALAELDMILRKYGYQLDFDELDRMIEEAVFNMNLYLKKTEEDYVLRMDC
jgi:hypothetical protein